MEFSFEEIYDLSGPPSLSVDPMMNRSSSESSFHNFIEAFYDKNLPSSSSVSTPPQILPSSTLGSPKTRTIDDPEVEIIGVKDYQQEKPPQLFEIPPNDSEEYQEYLRRKLDLLCAAAREKFASSSCMVKPPQVSTLSVGDNAMQKKSSKVQSGSTTSGALSKKEARKEKNKEAANRSRIREREILRELKTELSQLKVENASLQRSFAERNRKYNEAVVNKKILEAKVEALRAQFQLANEKLKQLTRLNPTLIQTTSNMSFTSMDAAVPVQDNQNQYYYKAPAPRTPHEQIGYNNSFSDSLPIHRMEEVNSTWNSKIDQTALMERVASLEHVQKWTHGCFPPPPPEPLQWDAGWHLLTPQTGGKSSHLIEDSLPIHQIQEVQNSTRKSKMGRTTSMGRVASLEHPRKRIRGYSPPPEPLQCNAGWHVETPQTGGGSTSNSQSKV